MTPHVCLIAEGSYPYVTGGVGKWTHDLIASLPEIEFSVVALWPEPGSAGSPRYPRPANVRELRHVYLMSGALGPPSRSGRSFDQLEKIHQGIMRGEPPALDGILDGFNGTTLLQDAAGWDLVCRMYETYAPPRASFPDYFWTWRAIYLPMFRALQAELPDCSVIHTISTGYAGLLGAAHSIRSGAPLITTEHGLYTRERAQEIWDTEWIPGEAFAQARRSVNFFKEWWNRTFTALERATYAHSDRVIALFEENRRYQVAHHAVEERTRVIPNGVDLAMFDEVRRKRRPSEQFHIGLVGRVVPIKDIKTFISAVKAVVQRVPAGSIRASIIGPTEEDELYASQCREMVRLLGLSDVVTFTGKVDSRKYYEVLDVVILTSLSEGQPLTLLEALACGIPAVATDVGACREILEGREGEDSDMGPAGIVTMPADPEETADAILQLLKNTELRRTMGDAGRRRVERFYRLEQVRENYLALYEGLAHGRS